MIIGDPYRFAIIMKTIKEWNIDETFCNGVLLFCVGGNIYPKEICNATLIKEVFISAQEIGEIAKALKID